MGGRDASSIGSNFLEFLFFNYSQNLSNLRIGWKVERSLRLIPLLPSATRFSSQGWYQKAFVLCVLFVGRERYVGVEKASYFAIIVEKLQMKGTASSCS